MKWNYFSLTLGLVLSTLVSHGQTKLLLVGGGKIPEESVKYMVEEGGGKKAKVLVFTWAENPVLDEDKVNQPNDPTSFDKAKARFGKYSPALIEEAVPLAKFKEGVGREELVKQIQNANVIFFWGGDQDLIMEGLNHDRAQMAKQGSGSKNIEDYLHEAYKKGAIMGGTSAGCAIMSKVMLSSDEDKQKPLSFRLDRGLGLMPSDWIVDQHFDTRNGRTFRMWGSKDYLSTIKKMLAEGQIDQAEYDRLLEIYNRVVDKEALGQVVHGLGVYEDCALLVIDGKTATPMGSRSKKEEENVKALLFDFKTKKIKEVSIGSQVDLVTGAIKTPEKRKSAANESPEAHAQ